MYKRQQLYSTKLLSLRGFASALLLEEGRGKRGGGSVGVGRHILASRGRAFRTAAQVRNYAPTSSMEEWPGPLCHVRGKCRAFYMCPHAMLRRGGGALGPDSLCWLLPCLLVRAERQKLVVIEEPGGGGRSLMSEQVGCVRS